MRISFKMPVPAEYARGFAAGWTAGIDAAVKSLVVIGQQDITIGDEPADANEPLATVEDDTSATPT